MGNVRNVRAGGGYRGYCRPLLVRRAHVEGVGKRVKGLVGDILVWGFGVTLWDILWNRDRAGLQVVLFLGVFEVVI